MNNQERMNNLSREVKELTNKVKNQTRYINDLEMKVEDLRNIVNAKLNKMNDLLTHRPNNPIIDPRISRTTRRPASW